MPSRIHAQRLALPCVLCALVVAAAPARAQGSVATGDAAETARLWLGSPRTSPATAAIAGPVFEGRGSMRSEQALAARVIRGWWPPVVSDTQAGRILDGFSRYLASRVVERRFDLQFLRTAHSVESRAMFGGHVVWSFPNLRLSRAAVLSRDADAAQFVALERWLGEGALQAAMREVAQLPESRLTSAEIITTVSRAAGQDLAWLFDAARQGVDYRVAALSSQHGTGCTDPCIETTVTIARGADGVFSGNSAARVGPFESGEAVAIRVTLADGSAVVAHWDGRDAERRFEFRGPSPAVAVGIDPGHLIAFERTRLDNTRTAPAPTNVPVRKWIARWVVWLQHTMLSYGSLA